MPSQGPQNAGSGSGTDWTDPGNITGDDGSNATAVLVDGMGATLLSAGHGFSIPSSSTIDGIEVTFKRSADVANEIRLSPLFMLKAGIPTGAFKTDTTNLWPTTAATVTYGSSSDLWGTTWLPSDINHAQFGASITAVHFSAANLEARIDFVSITVYYSEPSQVGRSFSVTRDSQSSAKVILQARGSSGPVTTARQTPLAVAASRGSDTVAARDDSERILAVQAFGQSRVAMPDKVSATMRPMLAGLAETPEWSHGRLIVPAAATNGRENSPAHSIAVYDIIVSGSLGAFGLPSSASWSTAPSAAITTLAATGRHQSVAIDQVGSARAFAAPRGSDQVADLGRASYLAISSTFGVASESAEELASFRIITTTSGRSLVDSGAAFGLKSAVPEAFGLSQVERHDRLASGARIQARGRDSNTDRDAVTPANVIGARGRLHDPQQTTGQQGAIDSVRGRDAIASDARIASRAAVSIRASDRVSAFEAGLGVSLAIVAANSRSAEWTRQTTLAISAAHGSDRASALDGAITAANAGIVTLAEVASRDYASAPRSTAAAFTRDLVAVYDRFRLVATVDVRGASFVSIVSANLTPSLSIQAIGTLEISSAAICRVNVY